jgi:hypothetical protein
MRDMSSKLPQSRNINNARLTPTPVIRGKAFSRGAAFFDSNRFLVGDACAGRGRGDPLVGVYARGAKPLLRGDPTPGGLLVGTFFISRI